MYICFKVVDNMLVIMDYKEMCLARIIDDIDKIIDGIDYNLVSNIHKGLIKRNKGLITFHDLSLLFLFLEKLVNKYNIILE